MKNILRAWMIIFVSLLTVSTLTAREVQMKNTKQGSNLKQTTAGCAPASAYDWLDINNVEMTGNSNKSDFLKFIFDHNTVVFYH